MKEGQARWENDRNTHINMAIGHIQEIGGAKYYSNTFVLKRAMRKNKA